MQTGRQPQHPAHQVGCSCSGDESKLLPPDIHSYCSSTSSFELLIIYRANAGGSRQFGLAKLANIQCALISYERLNYRRISRFLGPELRNMSEVSPTARKGS